MVPVAQRRAERLALKRLEPTSAQAHRLLRELIGQDSDIDDDEVPRLHRGTKPGRILSVHDPEMRHGRKSERQRFDGYKLHAAATNSERPLITAVEVEPASEQDGPRAKTLVDRQPEELRPERIVGDTAYGNQEVREEMEGREVEVLAPVPTSKKHHVFSKEDFEIDVDAGTVTCPAGKLAPISKLNRKGERVANFRRSDRPCPLRERCTAQDHRQVRLGRRENLLLAARKALEDPNTERAGVHHSRAQALRGEGERLAGSGAGHVR